MNFLRGEVRYSDIRGYLGHYGHRDRRSARKEVKENLALPLGMKGFRSSTVWGITMVRDEEDIIEDVLRHQISQGVSPILVADNNSRDNTPSILKRLSRELPIFVLKDSLSAYRQAEKMTTLSRLAFRHGARWIVPFDADEMWFAADMTVSDFLLKSNSSIVRAAMHNVYPGISGEPTKFEVAEQAMGKIAFRASYFALVGIGNHTVMRSGKFARGLYLAHFPWRSSAQLQRKTRQGRQALEDASLPTNMGSHWRALAKLSDQQLQELWHFVETQTPHPALSEPFAGPFEAADPKSWKTWEGPRLSEEDAGR